MFQLLPNAEIFRVMAMFGVCLERNDAFVAKNSRCLNCISILLYLLTNTSTIFGNCYV